jgi:hypothetical protein
VHPKMQGHSSPWHEPRSIFLELTHVFSLHHLHLSSDPEWPPKVPCLCRFWEVVEPRRCGLWEEFRSLGRSPRRGQCDLPPPPLPGYKEVSSLLGHMLATAGRSMSPQTQRDGVK